MLAQRSTAEMHFAFDLGKSVRSFDKDGHLKIASSPISKAAVNGYYGWEIPEHDALGLDPDRLYNLLRDPEELKRGAATFEGKPVMIIHRPATAQDHPRSLVVGSVSAPVTFDGTYLHAPLSIWDSEGIAGINDGSQRQLSSGYRYRADMTPGVYAGTPYDGVMRDIEANHVALVDVGRAGPDVMVGDSAPASARLMILSKQGDTHMKTPTAPSRTVTLAKGALCGYLIGKMAADQQIDLGPILQGVSAKTWVKDKARIIEKVNKALDGKLADGMALDALPEALATVDPDALAEAKATPSVVPVPTATPPNAGVPAGVVPPAKKPATDDTSTMKARVSELLEGKLAPEDLAAVLAALDTPVAHAATDEGSDETDVIQPTQEMPLTQAGMDAAIRKAVQAAETSTIARLNAITEARRLVHPLTGDIALDAAHASDIYKVALDQMEVDLTGVPASAYKGMFTAVYGAQAKFSEIAADQALTAGLGGTGMHVPAAYDGAAAEDTRKRFPTLSTRQV